MVVNVNGYEDVDIVITTWTHANVNRLFDEWAGKPARFAYLPGLRPLECFQIWVQPSRAGWIVVSAASVDTEDDSEHYRTWDGPVDRLSIMLNDATATVEEWANRRAADGCSRRNRSSVCRCSRSNRVTNYHRQILVFEHVSSSKAIRYVCYEDLGTGKFAVSSGEVLAVPQDDKTLAFHARQQAEHFITEGVSRWFDSLPEAVAGFAFVMDGERS